MTDSPSPLAQLLGIMERLRRKPDGCPWDLEQTFETIAPHTIEEAYEVADAIARKDIQGLRNELGDLLLQVVFHSQIAKEEGLFAFDDVAATLSHKLITRHPHIFGDDKTLHTADAVVTKWEDVKENERAAKGSASILDDVTLGLPALLRAEKLQKRAARIGFDWESTLGVFDKLDEEIRELKEAVKTGEPATTAEEIGDLLFTVVNLSRKLGLDPEEALRRTNRKFERRFRFMEACATRDGKPLSTLSLPEMDRYWDESKDAERHESREPVDDLAMTQDLT